jgi:hypothetical protein
MQRAELARCCCPSRRRWVGPTAISTRSHRGCGMERARSRLGSCWPARRAQGSPRATCLTISAPRRRVTSTTFYSPDRRPSITRDAIGRVGLKQHLEAAQDCGLDLVERGDRAIVLAVMARVTLHRPGLLPRHAHQAYRVMMTGTGTAA